MGGSRETKSEREGYIMVAPAPDHGTNTIPNRSQRQLRRHNEVPTPIQAGEIFVIPAGTTVWRSSAGSKRDQPYVTKRRITTRITSSRDGWVDIHNVCHGGAGQVILPEVTWRGTGSQLMTTKLTPELCGYNGAPAPRLPREELSDIKDRLDFEPTFGPGFDNRDM